MSGRLIQFVKAHVNEEYRETSPCHLKYRHMEYLKKDSNFEIVGYPGDKIPSQVENCGYHSMYNKMCGSYTRVQMEYLDLRFRYNCNAHAVRQQRITTNDQ